MVDKSGDLVQGTLNMLILKTLTLEPIHGWGVAARIEQISRGVFCVNAGFAVCRFTAAAASRIDPKRMESYREQPASEVLHPD